MTQILLWLQVMNQEEVLFYQKKKWFAYLASSGLGKPTIF